MAKQKINYLLKNSISSALKAGREIMKIYQSDDFNVEMKSDNSPLTKADKASHNMIIENLVKEIDGVPIYLLSEEGKDIPYEERKDWGRYWLIDPLDGTKEFIKRNGEFTVNIALIENNEPIIGVIYAPEYKTKIKDESKKDKGQDVIPNESGESSKKIFEKLETFKGALYFAAKDFGSFKASYINENLYLFKLDSHSKLSNLPASGVVQNSTLTAVGSRSHSSEEEKTKLEELGVTENISVGSSLKFCMVAEGRAQVYYRHGPTMEWDVAAGYSIAKEAGAKIDGLQFNKENLLNSSFLVSL